MGFSVLIPAYNPTEQLVDLTQELSQTNVDAIVIVNDGSTDDTHAAIFANVRNLPKVTLIEYAQNRGKGAALKVGLAHIQKHVKTSGVVTADADGQHITKDVLAIGEAIPQNPNALLLGSREVDEMPTKSYLGNSITRFVFRVFFGLNISDTQTGLRGFATDLIDLLLTIPYDRYEFESEMLMVCNRNGVAMVEHRIETIYIENNAASSFNPWVDSTRIYFVLFRYVFASLAAAIVDYIVFFIVLPLNENTLFSIFIARAVSLLVNYFLLRTRVFFATGTVRQTFPRYVALVIVSGFIASGLIDLLANSISMNIGLAKVLVESTLFVLNFLVNRSYIFINRRK
ncbi:MAG: glycosyltransferase [Chloroflexi bacterium]|nr:MAG: glycosyltransferase [Chloroflexota bacterium]MBL1193300.1 glycosyltransferase [Chloroflexota bacterium]NOH10592.1 bifunctional glycosyltransferase family 2/GtrA family protein [Chloroflexota bacterium]